MEGRRILQIATLILLTFDHRDKDDSARPGAIKRLAVNSSSR